MADLPTVLLMQPPLISTPFHRAGWVYEERVDSRRMVGYKNRAVFRLVSRNAKLILQHLRHHFRKGMRLIEFFEVADFVFRERDREGCNRAVEMFHFCGAYNWCGDCGVAEHPGEGDL